MQKMKCIPQLFLLLILLFSVPAYSDIAVIKTAGITAYDDVRNGFSSVCFENKHEFNLQEDLSNQTQINDELKAGTFSLILGIGSQAATFAKTNFPDIPLVQHFQKSEQKDQKDRGHLHTTLQRFVDGPGYECGKQFEFGSRDFADPFRPGYSKSDD